MDHEHERVYSAVCAVTPDGPRRPWICRVPGCFAEGYDLPQESGHAEYIRLRGEKAARRPQET